MNLYTFRVEHPLYPSLNKDLTVVHTDVLEAKPYLEKFWKSPWIVAHLRTESVKLGTIIIGPYR